MQEHYMKISIAALYAFLASVAFNLFWLPGNIYANGLTGFVQLIASILASKLTISIGIPLTVLLLNIPLLLIAWCVIDREFTIFTIISVLFTFVFMNLVPVIRIVNDPMICSIFGGIIHGTAVGITLNSSFSTGGLDILGILLKKKIRISLGSIFIGFNICIEFCAGFLYGWEYAFYSAMAVFVSGKTVDYVNTKQQAIQVMIVTNKAEKIINQLQEKLRRGITIVNNVEGAYLKEDKKILILVLSKKELGQLNDIIKTDDPDAFVSISSGISTNRSLYEW